MSQADEQFMTRALQIARRGAGYAEPNPQVGCVLVRRGRIIGEGYHRRFGGAHAEVDALRRVSGSPRGATAYVTLEPCCFTGKTPPCTKALIEAGVARVVIGAGDVNPKVSGRGSRLLRQAGIEVVTGVLGSEARDLVAPYAQLQQAGRPWVILKWAQTLDGAIATWRGDSRWITDEVARRHVHRVRARVDAIVVGSETVLRDDPLLTARGVRPRRVATRVVLDGRLRIPLRSQLVKTAGEVPTWVFTRRDASVRKRRRLEVAGCRVIPVAGTRKGLSLRAVLKTLGSADFTNVVVEGGGRVLGAFFDRQLADELHVYVAPRLIGGAAAIRPLAGRGLARITDSVNVDPALRRLGNGWLLEQRTRGGG